MAVVISVITITITATAPQMTSCSRITKAAKIALTWKTF
jgi:hypothetical protein